MEREEIEGKKECDRLKEAADEIYAAAPYHDTPMAMLDDPVLSKALSHLEDMLLGASQPPQAKSAVCVH